MCVYLSMERIEGASVKNNTGGEVFSEVCCVYFRECMCVCVYVRCTVGGLNLPWLDQWLTTGDEASMRAVSEIQHDRISRMSWWHLMDWLCLHRWKIWHISLREVLSFCKLIKTPLRALLICSLRRFKKQIYWTDSFNVSGKMEWKHGKILGYEE